MVRNESGAKSGARGDANAILADHDDPRLLGLIEAWQTLADETKAEILTLAGLRPYDLDDVVAASNVVGPARCSHSVPRLLSADGKGVAANGR